MEETIETPSAESIPSLSQEAYLVLIYPIGPGMGTRYRLGRAPVTIGRGSDCELLVNDHSVSRLHARIAWDSGGYVVTDLESTNGTLVNKIRTPTHRLTDGDYLQIGKCIYRFLAGDNMESEYHEEIYRLTIIDALTGIFNKRYFLEFLEGELVRSARYSR